jgi:type II secretory pathway pseudopilin PulG
MMSSFRPLRAARGFTLVELMVAMASGMMVSLGVFALAKVTSRTLNDETRLDTAEMSLRLAVTRLQGDIMRAGFMSSPNIVAQKVLSAKSRNLDSGERQGFVPPTPVRRGLNYLAAMNLTLGKLSTDAKLPLSEANLRTPDRLELAGNFTTSEQYHSEGANAGGVGDCFRLKLPLDGSQTAIRRLLSVDPSEPSSDNKVQVDALRRAFQPVVVDEGSGNPQFMVRVVPEGTSQTCEYYLATCSSRPPTEIANGREAYVYLEGSLPLGTPSCQLSENGGKALINPVQWVRWSLRASESTVTAASTDPASGPQYNLVRQYLDANLNPIRDSSNKEIGEIVAEYAVDFKVGLTVRPSAPGPLEDLAAGSTDLEAKISNYSLNEATAGLNPTPERIRSISTFIAVRGAIAESPLPGPDAGSGNLEFYRYRIPSPDGLGADRYARVRSLQTQFALPNLVYR